MSALQQPARLQPPRLQRLARRQTQAAVAARREAECACDRPAASPEGHWCPRHNHFIDASSSPGRDVAAGPRQSQAPAPAERAADRPSAQLTGSRDFVAGCAAGVCSTVVGHPFDTIKVRLQQGIGGSGPLSCAMYTVRREGAGGLFKGLASPMLTVPLVNAVVFGVYGHARSVLQARHPDQPLSGSEACAAGAWAGLVNTVVITPVELLKCRLQVAGDHPSGAGAELRALREEMGKVLREDGARGLWRGNIACGAREVASYIGMFGTYEVLKSCFGEDTSGPNASALSTVVSGGMAGVMCWTLSYPQDVVKTSMQVRSGPFSAGASAAAGIWAREGMRGFWKGYSAAVMRAIPANGAGFLAYEQVRSIFVRMDDE